MQLLIYITNKSEHVPAILAGMLDEHLGGASVINCEGMLQAISENSVEPPPMFGSLRKFVNPYSENGKMLLAALKDEQIPTAIAIIHRVAGDLKRANSGVLFTVPIGYSETLKEE